MEAYEPGNRTTHGRSRGHERDNDNHRAGYRDPAMPLDQQCIISSASASAASASLSASGV